MCFNHRSIIKKFLKIIKIATRCIGITVMKSREARRDDSIKHFNYHRELQQQKPGPLRLL